MVLAQVPGAGAPVATGDLGRRLPPGISLVPAADPVRAADRLARSHGLAPPCTAAEAGDELERRRDVRLADPRRLLDECRRRADEARAAAKAAREVLPAAVARVPAPLLRRAARTVDEGARAVGAARSGLGPRPHLDEDVARTARAAQAEVEEARLERAAVVPRANATLAMANAGAGVVVAGRLLSDAFDPAFFLVAVLPVAGLVIGGSAVARSVRRSRAAARRRWTALRSLDVCTMAGLEARERRVRAWDERARGLRQAEAALRRAEAAWRSLAGPGIAVAEAARVASEVQEAAALDRAARAAELAWANAAVVLQQAEDGAGADEAPIVVACTTPPDERSLTALARRAGRSTVIVVVASPLEAQREGSLVAEGAATVVDLRDRVLAGLLRLRSCQTPRQRPPSPGSVASG